MSQPVKTFYQNQANTIIRKLQTRNMDGYYCDNMEEAKQKVLELIGEPGKSVAYGGSMTIDDTNLKELITEAGHNLIVREHYFGDAEQIKELNALTINADTFLMSSNAITIDGELINIDGHGNRVSFLIYGPEQVILIVGMNKVVSDVNAGIERTHNIASPKNTIRLNVETPCAKTGVCAKCYTNSICSQIVITRTSRIPHRIKVVLVGEDLGY